MLQWVRAASPRHGHGHGAGARRVAQAVQGRQPGWRRRAEQQRGAGRRVVWRPRRRLFVLRAAEHRLAAAVQRRSQRIVAVGVGVLAVLPASAGAKQLGQRGNRGCSAPRRPEPEPPRAACGCFRFLTYFAGQAWAPALSVPPDPTSLSYTFSLYRFYLPTSPALNLTNIFLLSMCSALLAYPH